MWGVHRYMKEIIFSLNVKQELKMIGFELYWVGQEVHSRFSMRCYKKTKWPFWPTQCFQNMGFPGGASGKESACQYRKRRTLKFNPWVRKIPWRRKWQPTPVFLPGESHGQGSLAGDGPWGCKDGHDWTRTHNIFRNGCKYKAEGEGLWTRMVQKHGNPNLGLRSR